MRRAWVLAVAEELRLRDGDEAMRAVRELRHEWGEQSPRWLELAAAVHAEQGDFPQAVTLQLLALRRQGVEPEKLAPQDPRRLRLNAYRDNQPWREPGLPFAPSQGGP